MAGSEAAGFRLPKSRRLRRRREYLDMRAGSRQAGDTSADRGRGAPVRRRRAGRFVVVLRPRAPGLPGRLGITASRRIGRAVRRNRIRRLVREAYRTTPGLLPDGHDVLVIATTGEGEWNLARVTEELSRWR